MLARTHPLASRMAAITASLGAALAVTGCGGAGGGPSFAPAPPAAIPGFDVMADADYAPLSSEAAFVEDGHNLRITVDRDAGTYTVWTDDPSLAASSLTFAMASPEPGLMSGRTSETLPDGTQVDHWLGIYKDRTFALRHSAVGHWSYTVHAPGEDPRDWTYHDEFFVLGERTPASAVPVTGTATYGGNLSVDGCDCSLDASLTADFGAGEISAIVGWSPIHVPLTDNAARLNLSGSGPITGATFAFPLTGSAFVFSLEEDISWTEDASGSLAGAFFGPAAEEAGAVISVTFPSYPGSVEGAFALAR